MLSHNSMMSQLLHYPGNEIKLLYKKLVLSHARGQGSLANYPLAGQQELPDFGLPKGAVIIYGGGGGAVQIQKSLALKFCPSSVAVNDVAPLKS